MASKRLDRRAFLLGTAVLGGAMAVLGPARRAGAFTLQKIPPQSGLGIAIANRCKTDTEHAQILAELEKELASRTGASGSYVTETAYCPICGCPITAVRYIK
jgi:hypothetical protein